MRDLIRVQSETGNASGTKFTTADGAEIRGISEVNIGIKPSEMIEVRMTLCSFLDVRGVPKFQIIDPETGELRRVRAIEFEDGERREFASSEASAV